MGIGGCSNYGKGREKKAAVGKGLEGQSTAWEGRGGEGRVNEERKTERGKGRDRVTGLRVAMAHGGDGERKEGIKSRSRVNM